jgi:diguanylate cyclase
MASAPPPAPSAPAYGAPNARRELDLSLVPRQPESSLGPPELRLFSDEAGQRVEPFAPPPAPASAAAPAPRGATGPSDFTRMLTPVEAPRAAPAPAPPPRPAAKPDGAPAGGRKPSLLPLVLVVTFALVTAAALILYFVLRPAGAPR